MQLTFIIPVYNIERDLPSCLDSILSQSFQDYELILIDDGSTDSSGRICDDYSLIDNRVKVYHQKNAGVSAARNLGLEKARGKWICFVDGDDMLYPNSVEVVLREANKGEVEMIIARSHIFTNGEVKSERYSFDESFFNRTYSGYELIVEKSYKRGSVCGCVFKREFLRTNELGFPLGLKIGEDSIFISLVHLYLQNAAFIDQKFYLVNEREDSASRTWTFEKLVNMKGNIQFLDRYIRERPGLQNYQKHILDYSIYGVVSSVFNSLFHCFSVKNHINICISIQKEIKRKLDTGDISLSKGKVRLLNFSLPIYSFTVLLLQKFRQLSK